MSAVASQLRQAREALGLSAQQVAEATKIRSDHIEALDCGNYNVFSAPIYIRGFVKAYAREVKLNEQQVLAALDAELSRTDKFSEPPPLTDRPHTLVDTLTLLLSKINWKVGLVVVGAMVVLGVLAGVYTTWHHYKTSDPLAGLTPGVYQAPATGGDTLPLPAPRRP
jgi:cytoskeleton protein RodZ